MYPKPRSEKQALNKIFKNLYSYFGPQHWWPAKTRFEVIVGAILTQNTSWRNVELAIANLKSKKALKPQSIKKIPNKKLSLLIRPSGYFNIKAARLKSFTEWLYKNYEGSIDKMCAEPTGKLRKKLLDINGIGPETADSIILYAAKRPVFVVDSYTKRILMRHKIVSKDASYEDIQKSFSKNLTPNVKYFNEYHALLVRLAKTFCRKLPQCKKCPLSGL